MEVCVVQSLPVALYVNQPMNDKTTDDHLNMHHQIDNSELRREYVWLLFGAKDYGNHHQAYEF